MTEKGNSSLNWKTPNELIKLHKLKQKKRALQERVNKTQIPEEEKQALLEAPFVQKRRNPFAKQTTQNAKRSRLEPQPVPERKDTSPQIAKPPKEEKSLEDKLQLVLKVSDPKISNKQEVEEELIVKKNYWKDLPLDWTLKTRMRIFAEKPLPGMNLKPNQEASGITSFVRCINPTKASTGVDISEGARFHQSTLYWQHPSLPWLKLFPRNSKENSGFQIGEAESESLRKDWEYSFEHLYQLVRARQCPYFYLCANNFTVLFRAPGIGGKINIHAILSPTSRGFRAALKEESIDFVQLFKKESKMNNSSEENNSGLQYEDDLEEHQNDDDEDDIEQWLESLGVDASEIKNIQMYKANEAFKSEGVEDYTDSSLILVEGVDCQLLYKFLLEPKTAIATVGNLASIPPTLLAPVAFPGGTLRQLQTRSSKVRMEGVDYFSIELQGVILPHTLHGIAEILVESYDAFSATMSLHSGSLALCKASQKLIQDSEKENNTVKEVFRKENLSDCGLQSNVVEAMCSVSKHASTIMERMWYEKGEGYAWN